MADGLGMFGALRQAGCEPAGKGCSWTGGAIALALMEAGVTQLAVHDTDTRRRDQLITRLHERSAPVVSGSTDPTGCDLVINASPCGMQAGDPLPVDVAAIRREMTVVDVITVPAQTPLLGAAASLGCRTVPGSAMFAAQAGLVATFLLGETR